MMVSEEIPIGLVSAIAGSLLAGLIGLTWGRLLPRRGDWLAWLGLVALAGVSISGLIHYFEGPSESLLWFRGWVWPPTESGSLNIGIVRDPLGLSMTLLASLVGMLFLANQRGFTRGPRQERIYSSCAIVVPGLALTWVSATPWLAFVGLFVVTLGGFISLGCHWEEDSGASLSIRFGRERVLGILLALFGAFALISHSTNLNLGSTEGWASDFECRFGAFLLVGGVFLQIHPFPLLGWLVAPSKTRPFIRVPLTQVFPAWAALAVLIRLEPQLRQVGVFPVFGWIALLSLFLAVMVGLFQGEWCQGIGVWVSAAFSASISILAFAGPRAALAVAIGMGLAAVALSLTGSLLSKDGATGTKPHSDKVAWIQAACFVSALAGSGMAGFVSGEGMMRWLAIGMDRPVLITFFTIAFFLLSLMTWNLTWSVIKSAKTSEVGWLGVISSFLLLVLAFGMVWTGTLTGEVLPGSMDRFFGSILSSYFPSTKADDLSVDLQAAASLYYWGVVILAVVAGYWSSARVQNVWLGMKKPLPRTVDFIAEGYGVDRLSAAILRVILQTGRGIVWLADWQIWGRWVPTLFGGGLRWLAGGTASVDEGISRTMDGAVKTGIQTPAKFLQLIQNGNVQWYLFFAVGFGIVILIHFLRFY